MKKNVNLNLDPETIELVLNEIRRATIKWKTRTEVLERNRKQVLEGHNIGGKNKGKPKYKFFWHCAKCDDWFRNEKDMEVDHIIEIGTFTGCLNDFANKVFCSIDNLQVLCISCHAKKTATKNSSVRYERKIQKDYDEL